MPERYIDPNSGAAPQPGGLATVSQPAPEPAPEPEAAPESVEEQVESAGPDVDPTESSGDTEDSDTEGAGGTQLETQDEVQGSQDSTVAQDDYDDKNVWSYDDLRAEIHNRNEGREEKISAQGSRADLIERLREDDAVE